MRFSYKLGDATVDATDAPVFHAIAGTMTAIADALERGVNPALIQQVLDEAVANFQRKTQAAKG